MAGKFGADFNASQPSDADLVKKGAQWIRDIKSRIKTTYAVCFNIETGQLLNESVPTAALKTLNPSPAGTWKEVDVNAKGLVTGGRNPDVTTIMRPYRYIYSYLHGYDPDKNLITRSTDTDADGLNVATYSFAVPEGVTRLLVRAWGAGGGGGYNVTPLTAGGGGGGGYAECMVEVSEGDVFLIWVGEGGIGMTSGGDPAANGGETKFEKSALQYIKAFGGEAGTATTRGVGGEAESTTAFDGWGPDIAFDGAWGTIFDGGAGGGGATGLVGSGGMPLSTGAIAGPGNPGCVIVEYLKS